ncbi:MAG: phosphoglycolate phosphatase [Pseudohongiellaceae bacterium]|jgi:phosphoglycolate phosphatase
MSGQYEVVVFDWDGTLVNSEAHIVASIGYAARAACLPALDYDVIKDIIGLGMREALLVLYPELTDEQVVELRQHYSQFFFSKDIDQSILFDGVLATLDQLLASGLKLAVATGKSRNGLDKALEATGLKSYFEIERCADETRSKPHPMMLAEISEHFGLPPAKMFMVGDTEYDLDMAARFGMDSVGVSYGVHDVARLNKHKPLKVVDHISEILALI